jgi:hypothetical protein
VAEHVEKVLQNIPELSADLGGNAARSARQVTLAMMVSA